MGALCGLYDFAPYTGSQPPADSIYYEPNLLGGRAIVPNNGESSKIDMELLFNAVIYGKIKQ